MKKSLMTLLVAMALTTGAQAQQTVTLDRAENRPFSYTVQVPDGNYRVTVTLGSRRRAAQTVVRAESRRHYFDAISTKKGRTTR